MSRYALTRGGPVRFLAVAATSIILTAAATPAQATEATDHNARVAEYLLLQHPAAAYHNARVAEYLLQHGD